MTKGLQIIFFCILTGTTIAYLLQSAWMDLREREIYTAPAWVLSAAWVVFSIMEKGGISAEMALFSGIQTGLYVLFCWLRIWGGGDSDIFLLMSAVFLREIWNFTLQKMLLLMCIFLITALLISAGIGWVQYRKEHRKIGRTSDIAVVPGFSAVIAGYLVCRIAGGLF